MEIVSLQSTLKKYDQVIRILYFSRWSVWVTMPQEHKIGDFNHSINNQFSGNVSSQNSVVAAKRIIKSIIIYKN